MFCKMYCKFCSFELILYVPVNNFSVKLGRLSILPNAVSIIIYLNTLTASEESPYAIQIGSTQLRDPETGVSVTTPSF